MTCDSVDLPEPFGPMIACTSPSFTVNESPWRISRSSTRTCRFLISSNAIVSLPFVPYPEERRRRISKDEGRDIFRKPSGGTARPSRDEVLADRSLERDRDQLLCLDCELHRELLQYVLDEAIDDEADRLLLTEPALDAVEQHVLGDLGRRRFVLEHGRG